MVLHALFLLPLPQPDRLPQMRICADESKRTKRQQNLSFTPGKCDVFWLTFCRVNVNIHATLVSMTNRTNNYTFAEYHRSPRMLDRIAQLIGRKSVEVVATVIENSEYDGPSINDLLDEYATNEASFVLSPASREARMLALALRQGPRLSSPLFAIHGMPCGTESIQIKARSEWPVALPTNNFVFAPEMNNWVDGRGCPKYIGGRTVESRQLIADYARQSTLAPPIGEVIAHVQPNNLVLYSVNLDGAHRTAAAMLRGDEGVNVGDTIYFERLNEDIVAY